jgi:hypothetical protein
MALPSAAAAAFAACSGNARISREPPTKMYNALRPESALSTACY